MWKPTKDQWVPFPDPKRQPCRMNLIQKLDRGPPLGAFQLVFGNFHMEFEGGEYRFELSRAMAPGK